MANVKMKQNVGLKPELREQLLMVTHANAVAAVAASGTDVATLLSSHAATVASFNALVTNYNSLLAKLRAAGMIDS